jgi:hypothetical protein
VEQQTGPFVPPISPAGVDPAYIPGLTPPRTAEAVTEARPTVPAQAADEDAAGEKDEVAPAAVEKVMAATVDPEETEEEDVPVPDDGPVFEVSDRRSAIIADHLGITLRLDDQEAEFRWNEIGAVEIDTPRFGRRFAVTVYTTTRRWYAGDVEAPSRSRLKEWTAELDAVLDARFEDTEADAESAPESDAGSAADGETED